ncbi:MAG: COG2426 family protein [Candidatus Methanomethylophilaceae archaeon]|jgi:uncharacterized membrane protein
MMNADWLLLALLSMVPFWESRYTIPLAISQYGIDPLEAYVWCCAFNILAVPVIYFCLDVVYRRWLHRVEPVRRVYEWCVRKVSSKEKGILEKWQELGLIIFVAIPIPATGVWTGTLLAWLFELEFKKSFLVLGIGVMISSTITTLLTLGILGL